MDTIFTLGDFDDDDNTKVNLDDLYERKQQHDLNTMRTYNRILNRINNKVRTVSRIQTSEQFCWYVIPEHIIGVPRFDKEACTAFIIDKLTDNGFILRYTHPNLLFISWKHWVPAYVRSEIKKKTGVSIDGYGNKVEKRDDSNIISGPVNPDELMFQRKDNFAIGTAQQKQFTAIDTYNPSGNLIYNHDLLRSIEGKSRKT
jgi:hypothetical protein